MALPSGWTVRVHSVPSRIAEQTRSQRASNGGGIIVLNAPAPRRLSNYFERRRTTLDQSWTWRPSGHSPLTLIGPDSVIGSGYPFSIGGDRGRVASYYGWRWQKNARARQLRAAIGAQTQANFQLLLFVEDTAALLGIKRKAIDNTVLQHHWKRRREAFHRTLGWTVPGGFADIPTSFYATNRCEIMGEIQRHLLEPTIDGGVTWSSLWTAEEVDEFITLRVNRFILETMMISVRTTIDVTAGTGDYELPDVAMESLRVVFTPTAGTEVVLDRIDAHVSDNGYQTWQGTPGSPVGYIEYPGASNSVTIVPTPTTGGVLTIDYVPRQDDPTLACEAIEVPNQFAWCIKWGVIADLLAQEGEANDPVRAEKAENLFKLGVDLAKLSLSQVK